MVVILCKFAAVAGLLSARVPSTSASHTDGTLLLQIRGVQGQQSLGFREQAQDLALLGSPEGDGELAPHSPHWDRTLGVGEQVLSLGGP